jgi:uncharacterized protein
MLSDYHHFKGEGLSRSEKVQRKVTQILLESDLIDEKRESSVIWEMKHSCSCTQIGRILAEKRNLKVEIAEIICILHDIYVIMEGKYKNHAKLGVPIAKKILDNVGGFTKEEIKTITEAIANHSDKHKCSDDPYIELAKDADVMDCSLYEGVEGYYKLHKPKTVFDEYVKRIKRIRKELGMQTKKVFR